MLGILLFFGCFTHASTLHPKWDFELREQSRKFSSESYPTKTIDAWWANPEPNRKSGLLALGAKGEYRHMHAMVVAAFYAKRKNQRALAFEWLEKYECENWIACRDAFDFYDGALKANSLSLSPKERKEAEKIREKFALENKEKAPQKQEKSGLCAPSSPRDRWLEEEYRLFCPRGKMVRPGGLSDGSEELKALETKLKIDSGQYILSSSYLDKLEHLGKEDCSEPWKVKLKCGGGLSAEYLHQCRRTDTGSVSCKQLSSK